METIGLWLLGCGFHIRETWLNKTVAIILFALGFLTKFLSNDGTAFLFITLFVVIPLFFTKSKVIIGYQEEEEP